MFSPFRYPMISSGEDDMPGLTFGFGSSQFSNGGQSIIIFRSRNYKCHRGHIHNDQEEVEHCNIMSIMTLLVSKTNRCHQGHEHANSREVTECNELEEKIQRMRTDSSTSEIRFRQTITDRDGRTIQNEIAYKGNPDRIRGFFGNFPALGQSGGSSYAMSLFNFPFN